MRNCLILGSGRSGTSMVAGSLADAGYFMGENPLRATPSNPKGFFEDREINSINEELLKPVVPGRPRFLGRWFFKDRPLGRTRWLARVKVGTEITCPPEIERRIILALETQPYCYKDPRFSYTLPAWRPFLKETVFVCVFRHPSSTARSIVKESQQTKYRKRILLKYNHAIELWNLQYSHILNEHRNRGEWLFLHYNQVLQRDGLKRLGAFLDAPVDMHFPDSRLQRNLPDAKLSGTARRLYTQLCDLAEFHDTLV